LGIISKTAQQLRKDDRKSIQSFEDISISASAMSKRYKMVTLHGTLELIIYKQFLLSEIFRVAKFILNNVATLEVLM